MRWGPFGKHAVWYQGHVYCCIAGAEAWPEDCPWHKEGQPETRTELDPQETVSPRLSALVVGTLIGGPGWIALTIGAQYLL
jgi:hypothetical protein